MQSKKIFVVLFIFFISFFNKNIWALNNTPDKKYIFSIEEMQNMSSQANNDVNKFLELHEPTTDKLEQMARNFFHLRDDHQFKDLAKAYHAELVLERTQQLFLEKYPDLIMTDSKWVWNNVGGVYARIKILYCSNNEYLVLWGTQTKQSGFSGRYPEMNVWDIMLTGEMTSYGSSTITAPARIYKPGDISILEKSETRQYSLNDHTYMIDYGRDNISSAFYQGVLAPWLFNNHDNTSLKEQLGTCGRSILKEMF